MNGQYYLPCSNSNELKKTSLFFRLSNSPHGPSAKFLVQNSKLTQFKIFYEKIENNLWDSCVEVITFFVAIFLVHTLAELKMTGNCLKGSRPLLSFDPVSFSAYEV